MDPKNKEPLQTQNPQTEKVAGDPAKNPFKEDAPVVEAGSNEDAENEQKFKEALTERD